MRQSRDTRKTQRGEKRQGERRLRQETETGDSPWKVAGRRSKGNSKEKIVPVEERS